MNEFNNQGGLSQSIKIISNCPVCSQAYNSLEARIIADNGNEHLLFIRCRHCLSGLVALITINNFGINSLGIITDLNGAEIVKYADFSPISAGDIIDFHLGLKDSTLDKMMNLS